MKIGTFTLEQLSEGFFELFEDGSFQKMDPSRLKYASEDPTLGKYSTALGIDPLLIITGSANIIVDPGIGWGLDHKSRYQDTSNIITNLDIFGLRPEDIDAVVLTHLHFDHSAGSTFISGSLYTTPTFPNARYIVHRDEWEFALSKVLTGEQDVGAGYQIDELYRLAADQKIEFLKQDIHELTGGIYLIKTGGHTPGHMIVKIQSEGKKAYFMGDLVPTEYHLNHYSMKQVDVDPIQSKKAKTLLLRQAYQEKAVMFFYHSLYKKAGRLSRDEHKKYVLLDN